MNVYQVYDQAEDSYSAVAAYGIDDAARRYIAENPPDLMVTEVSPNDDDMQKLPEWKWRNQVANLETTQGYAEWVADNLTQTWRGL